MRCLGEVDLPVVLVPLWTASGGAGFDFDEGGGGNGVGRADTDDVDSGTVGGVGLFG